MATDDDDDAPPVFGRGSYLNISQDALLTDDPHEGDDRVRGRSVGIAVGVAVGLAVAGGIGWYVYSRLPGTAPAGTDIPILRAPSGPVKIKPNDPGGLEVPNRDKLIYQQFGETVLRGEERLLPPAESPVEPPMPENDSVVSFPAPETFPNQLDSDLTMPMAPPPIPQPGKPESTVSLAAPFVPLVSVPASAMPPAVSVPPPASLGDLITRQAEHAANGKPSGTSGKPDKPAPVATVQPVKTPVPAVASLSPAPKTVPASPSFVKPAAPSTATGGARVQLGSFKSIPDAEKAWSQLLARHGDLFKNVPHTVTQVDLGAKGVWYRIYVGPYGDGQAALSLCDTLKQRNVGCLFAR